MGLTARDINLYVRTIADALAILGEHTVWMLNFDWREDISMDEQGIRMAFKAFWRNDPYIPRPGSGLWRSFREQYLRSSLEIG